MSSVHIDEIVEYLHASGATGVEIGTLADKWRAIERCPWLPGGSDSFGFRVSGARTRRQAKASTLYALLPPQAYFVMCEHSKCPLVIVRRGTPVDLDAMARDADLAVMAEDASWLMVYALDPVCEGPLFVRD